MATLAAQVSELKAQVEQRERDINFNKQKAEEIFQDLFAIGEYIVVNKITFGKKMLLRPLELLRFVKFVWERLTKKQIITEEGQLNKNAKIVNTMTLVEYVDEKKTQSENFLSPEQF